jgi:hypothetical protein
MYCLSRPQVGALITVLTHGASVTHLSPSESAKLDRLILILTDYYRGCRPGTDSRLLSSRRTTRRTIRRSRGVRVRRHVRKSVIRSALG